MSKSLNTFLIIKYIGDCTDNATLIVHIGRSNREVDSSFRNVKNCDKYSLFYILSIIINVLYMIYRTIISLFFSAISNYKSRNLYSFL